MQEDRDPAAAESFLLAVLEPAPVWPAKLKVELMAISTSNDPFSVQFTQYDLKTKGAKSE